MLLIIKIGLDKKTIHKNKKDIYSLIIKEVEKYLMKKIKSKNYWKKKIHNYY